MRVAPSGWQHCPLALPSKWTRSSRFATDPLAPGRNGFAHRGLHDGRAAPENTSIAFAAAVEAGIGIECDLRLNEDRQVFVFHDADCRRMCGSPLVIGQATTEELNRLKVHGHPIPTLEDVFFLVANRVPLLLELKVAKDLYSWTRVLPPLVDGYRGPLGVISFDPRVLWLLKSRLPGIRRGLLIAGDLSVSRRRLYRWLAKPDFLAVEFSAIDQPWVARCRRRQPIYCWTVRTKAERAQAEVHADALIWEADGRP